MEWRAYAKRAAALAAVAVGVGVGRGWRGRRQLHQHRAIAAATLQLAIPEYAQRAVTPDDLTFTPLAGGMSALRIWKVDDPAGLVPSMVVRLDAPQAARSQIGDENTPNEDMRAVAVHREAATAGAAPAILHCGHYDGPLPFSGGVVTIMEYVDGPGNPPPEFPLSDTDSRAVGRLLARLHTVKTDGDSLGPFTAADLATLRGPADLGLVYGLSPAEVDRTVEALGTLPLTFVKAHSWTREAWVEPSLRNRLTSLTRRLLLGLPRWMRSPLTSRLVCAHGDVHPGNIMRRHTPLPSPGALGGGGGGRAGGEGDRERSIGEGQERRFPARWGDPPSIQTEDLRQLPGGYGMGSSTLARWVQQHLDDDAASLSEWLLIDFELAGLMPAAYDLACVMTKDKEQRVPLAYRQSAVCAYVDEHHRVRGQKPAAAAAAAAADDNDNDDDSDGEMSETTSDMLFDVEAYVLARLIFSLHIGAFSLLAGLPTYIPRHPIWQYVERVEEALGRFERASEDKRLRRLVVKHGSMHWWFLEEPDQAGGLASRL